MSTLNAGETLQPFKPLRNNLIFDSSGNLVGIQNDRANGNDFRIGGGSGVDGTFATLVATTALKINSGGTFDLYNTADQTTNYERLRADWSGNVARIYTQFGGSASTRAIFFGVGATAGNAPNESLLTLQRGAGPFVSFNSNVTSSVATAAFASAGGTITAASGTQTAFAVTPTINQSGTAGYTALDINPTETATGSGTKLLQRWAVGGAVQAQLNNIGQLYAYSPIGVNWIGWAPSIGGTVDTALYRDGSDTLALRRLTNAQTFRVYNTYTDGSNYRRWNLSWNTTTAIMQVVGAGTGTNGNLAVGNAALATTDTVGYFMIPSCAGAPTGVPADIPAGQVALHFDSTNNKLYVYDGGWISTAALT